MVAKTDERLPQLSSESPRLDWLTFVGVDPSQHQIDCAHPLGHLPQNCGEWENEHGVFAARREVDQFFTPFES